MGDKLLERLVLIDGHAMLYRAWFAFPKSLTKRDGTLVNAVYGFARILLNVISELKPEYLAVSFDVGKTFRHEMYADYKAHREKMPDELKAQEPITYQLVQALNVPVFIKETFEADDVIGTLARQASSYEEQGTRNKIETIIVTGDKDSLQLVSDDGWVKVYMPARANKPAVVYDENEVVKDLGITAEQIPDYKGLAGDHSDNIPGVRGIGPKTASALLAYFGSLERLYWLLLRHKMKIPDRLAQHIRQVVEDDTLGMKSVPSLSIEEAVKQAGLSDGVKIKLENGVESAFESKRLATIVTDVPLILDLEAARVRGYNKATAVALFKDLQFSSLLSKLPGDEFEASVQEALF